MVAYLFQLAKQTIGRITGIIYIQGSIWIDPETGKKGVRYNHEDSRTAFESHFAFINQLEKMEKLKMINSNLGQVTCFII